MIKRGLDATMNAADVITALPSAAIERKGRWRSWRRAVSAVLLLGLLGVPPLLVTLGVVEPVGSEGSVASGTMMRASGLIAVSLVVAVSLAVLLAAYRCWELVDTSRGPGFLVTVSTAVLGGLALVCVLTGVQTVLLWRAIGSGTTLDPGDVYWATLIAVGVGLLLMSVLAMLSSPGFWWRRGTRSGELVRRRTAALVPQRFQTRIRAKFDDNQLRYWRSVLCPTPEQLTRPELPGTVICCSGGGIRSASFCLGGLQELQRAGEYRRASAVVGVSGGGYIATAMHIIRWRSGLEQEPPRPWAKLEDEPYAPGTPEFHWLRRHTRYLFDSARMATLAALTVVFGMAVNLFWCAAILGGLAWWTGWLLLASGGLTTWTAPTTKAAAYAGDWAVLEVVWIVPLVGAGLFVLERVVIRLGTLPAAIRETVRTGAVGLIWVGLGLVALLIGLPSLMAAIHNLAWFGRGPVGDLTRAVGLRNDAEALTVVKTTGGSIAAIAAAVLAVVRLGVSKVPVADPAKKGSQALSRIVLSVKQVVLPWAALALIIVSALILLMSWIAGFVARPELLTNWRLLLLFVAITVLIKITTDANWTSLHHFYRERLSYAFLQERTGRGRSEPVPYRRLLRFSQSRPPEKRGPELIACAVANISDPEFVPTDRRATPFVFDARRTGLTDKAFPAAARRMCSATYEFAADPWFRTATMPAAMAMSGAAFSPLVGREQGRVAPFRFIMALANARLGVWLPNPLWTDEVREAARMVKLRRVSARDAWRELGTADQNYLAIHKLNSRDRAWLAQIGAPDAEACYAARAGALPTPVRSTPVTSTPVKGKLEWATLRHWVAEVPRWILNQPGGFRVLKEAVGKTSVMDRRLYITDGGHYDNTGLVEALRRRPNRIIVLDASNDAADSFRALGEAVATARMDLGCEVSIDPTPMVAGTDGVASQAWVSGTARYDGDDDKVVEIHFIKAVKTASMSLDTQVYARQQSAFPRTSTGNQFYGEFDLEAYRQLGVDATHAWLESVKASRRARRANRPVPPVPNGKVDPATVAEASGLG